MDKKRRAGRPGEFLDSLSVGGPRRGDEWYARTGGLRWSWRGGIRRGPHAGQEGIKRDPTGPPDVGDTVEWGIALKSWGSCE